MKYFVYGLTILLLLCIVLFGLVGCWDNRDITELGIVSAVGIDKAKNNEINLTIQIIKTGTLSAQEQGSTDDATYTFSTTGKTVFEAARNLLSTVNHKPLYSHTEVIVIGEDIAREGFADVLDFFERDHETRRRAYVLIAKGISAKEVINAKSTFESIPGLHIANIIKNTKALPKIKEIELIDLLKELSSGGKSSVVTVIQSIDGKKSNLEVKDLKVEGGAVFKKDKLVGWLDPTETRGYLFAIDEVQNGIINIPNPKDTDKSVSIEVKKVSSQIDVELKDDEPVLLIDMKIDGNIGGQQGAGDLTTTSMVEKVNKEIEELVKEEVKSTVELVQRKFKSDIFGFGEVMHRKYPSFWNTVKGDWGKEFAKALVEIKVEATLRQSGLIKDPVAPK